MCTRITYYLKMIVISIALQVVIQNILFFMFIPIVLSLMNHECYVPCPSWTRFRSINMNSKLCTSYFLFFKLRSISGQTIDWDCSKVKENPRTGRTCKGVGEGGRGARASPLSKVGGTSGFVPPPPHTFGQSKCSNFTICTYFVVKNTIFSKFSWLASLANFNKSIFSKLC